MSSPRGVRASGVFASHSIARALACALSLWVSTVAPLACRQPEPHKPVRPTKATRRYVPPRRTTAIEQPRVRALLQRAGIDAASIACNSQVTWVPGLTKMAERAAEAVARKWSIKPTAKLKRDGGHVIVGHVVRLLFEHLRVQNLGVMALDKHHFRTSSGKQRPLLVFRSAVTTDADAPQSCVRSLIGHGHVKHLLNLYGGDFPFRDFIRKEQRVAKELGVTHADVSGRFGPWRELIKRPNDYEHNRQAAMTQVAALIRREILWPAGKPPRGNVYLHCGGGMHRSGMVFGILRRCINGDPMALIEQEYKQHTAYRSNARPGGYERLNIQFIRDFDCALLQSKASNSAASR